MGACPLLESRAACVDPCTWVSNACVAGTVESCSSRQTRANCTNPCTWLLSPYNFCALLDPATAATAAKVTTGEEVQVNRVIVSSGYRAVCDICCILGSLMLVAILILAV